MTPVPEVLQTKDVLSLVIAESRSLFTELCGLPGTSSALKKRCLTLHGSATLKMLSEIQKLEAGDGHLRDFARQPEPVHDTADWFDRLLSELEGRARHG